MDPEQESQNQETQMVEETTPATEKRQNSPEVGFPLSPKSKEKSSKAGLIILVIVALLGIGIFFLTKRAGEKEIAPIETPTVTSSPTSTATPVPVDKSKVKIEVQNGTGIAGEAAYLQGKLRDAGYTDIAVGNAASQDHTAAEVTFKSGLNQGVVDEITGILRDSYQNVTTKTSSTQTRDVVVITGLRKGQTARPSPTATPTSSPTGSPTATPTPTATP